MGLKLYKVTYDDNCSEYGVPPIVAEFTAESEKHITSRFGKDLICFNRITNPNDSIKVTIGMLKKEDIEWDE